MVIKPLLSESEIQKIREREQKATKGPWLLNQGGDWGLPLHSEIYGEDGLIAQKVGRPVHIMKSHDPEGSEANAQQRKDFEFLVKTRQDIPALLADREELVRQNTEMEKTLHAIAICPDFYSNMDKLPGLARSCLKFLRSPQEP